MTTPVKATFTQRACISFWLFGLINNLFYVIILSAALDLVGPSIPKGTVLLASIIPSLATKSLVPYVIHVAPYGFRILVLALLSVGGMLMVTMASPKAVAVGIVLANLSAGAGEVHFLSLTHFYGPLSLAAWGSGTGAAGLVGAGAYALATNVLHMRVRTILLLSTLAPVVMVLIYFSTLPLEPLAREGGGHAAEREGLLAQTSESQSLGAKLRSARALIWPYMLPLFLVYVAEYTINQGVTPTLLFPLEDTPFKHYRAFYPTYGAIYQLGVFISRSSLPFVRVRTLYAPSLLQVGNLGLLIMQSLYMFIPNLWIVFLIIFWEGLLGGLVYVSTFAAIREEMPAKDREFSLGVTSVGDSLGITVAGFLSVVVEKTLCLWQVRHGIDWCTRL
ncbi:protein btn1 [Piedraia hortae CBS 480.64]|uniref:Protein BTN n=1 Tax=Piedraia hortae CBS 480.64 TaxID=1314780 RepID=A0A6A7BTB6_9PEZI|nr:protein btn1 [Piedraia hortae CBS 480.64]